MENKNKIAAFPHLMIIMYLHNVHISTGPELVPWTPFCSLSDQSDLQS